MKQKKKEIWLPKRLSPLLISTFQDSFRLQIFHDIYSKENDWSEILKIGNSVQNGCQNGFQIIETSQHTSMSHSLDPCTAVLAMHFLQIINDK